MASRTHGYGFGLPTTPITPRVRAAQGTQKMILKADGSLVPPHDPQPKTDAERAAEAVAAHAAFVKRRDELIAAGVLPKVKEH